MSAPKDIKLALCLPSTGMWHADFGMSFAQLCVYLASNLFEVGQNRTAIVIDKRTSMLPQSRQECLEDALMQECTHACFIDTDQSFPPEIVHRLMAHKKPFVGCNIALKVHPSFPTARLRGPTPFGIPLTSESEKKGLEKVWRLGFGLVLMQLDFVKRLPKPWFELKFNHEAERFVGEDWHFCELLEKAGIDVLIDHDASRLVGHVGQYTFTHNDIPLVPQAQAA